MMTYTRLKRLPRHERLHKLDILGAGLMMAAAVPLLLALTWGGTRYPWLSLPIIALVAASGLLSLAFGWRLTRAPEPFLPLSVLADPIMYMGTAANSFAMGASIGLVIFVPLYYELVHHLSASDSGLALIPLALTTPGSILSGRAMLHMRKYKWVPLVGLVVGIAGLGFLIWQPALSLWGVIVIMSLVGLAVGTVFPVCTVSIQNAVPNHQVGVAMGAMNFFRALASAFAVAIMGAILLAGLGVTLARGGNAAAVTATAGGARLRFRRCVPLGVRGRRGLSGRVARDVDLHGGASAARAGAGRGREAGGQVRLISGFPISMFSRASACDVTYRPRCGRCGIPARGLPATDFAGAADATLVRWKGGLDAGLKSAGMVSSLPASENLHSAQ